MNYTGAKYSRDLSNTAIAKLIRSDIKAAIAAGDLPKGLKVSVRKSGNSINLSITAFPGPVCNPANVYGHALSVYEQRGRVLYSAPVRRTLNTLEAIANEYNRDDSRIEEDYFNTNFYLFTSVASECSHAERDALLTGPELEDLRALKLAIGLAADEKARRALENQMINTLDAYDTSGTCDHLRAA